jgi:hypothetical protein
MPNWKDIHKAEATDFVSNFYRTAWEWRQNSYHDKWDLWEGNYRNIYDPDITALKEDWQAKMFIPVTCTNVEVICAALQKVLLGKEVPMGLKPREMGDRLQAELNTALLAYGIDRSGFTVQFNDAVREALIFGSGFLKWYWETKIDKRRINVPVKAGYMESALSVLKGQPQKPGSVKGYKQEVQDVVVRKGPKCEKVHIRDIFLEPNSTDLQRVLHRQKIAYHELKSLSDQGYFDKGSVADLLYIEEADDFEQDLEYIKGEEEIEDPKLNRPKYDKQHTVWEYWGPIPRKWIELELSDDSKKANDIVPGKIMVASNKFFLASEENPYQCMEPPFVQMDYIRTGQTYGTGVAQLIEGLQEEINEIRNLRVDNVNLVINKMFVVLEKKLVDTKEVRSMPGAIVRIKGSDVDDARKAIYPVEMQDITQSAYRETFELERQIQEVTGANRVTTGSAGQVRDANQTLGGMELLQKSAADRFIAYAYIMGKTGLVGSARKCFELMYQYTDEEMLRRILGVMPLETMNMDTGEFEVIQKWQSYKPVAPHELEMDYDFIFHDVFSEETKFQKAQSLMSYGQFLATTLPQWNPVNLAKRLGSLQGLTAEEVYEIVGDLNKPIPTPMSQGIGMPSISKMPGRAAPQGTPKPAPAIPGGNGSMAPL